MALFKQVVDAYIASKDLDESALSRLGFWVGELGDRELATITAEDIDAALMKLAARGRLRGGKLRISANVDAGFSVNVDGVSAGWWTIPEARE